MPYQATSVVNAPGKAAIVSNFKRGRPLVCAKPRRNVATGTMPEIGAMDEKRFIGRRSLRQGDEQPAKTSRRGPKFPAALMDVIRGRG